MHSSIMPVVFKKPNIFYISAELAENLLNEYEKDLEKFYEMTSAAISNNHSLYDDRLLLLRNLLLALHSIAKPTIDFRPIQVELCGHGIVGVMPSEPLKTIACLLPREPLEAIAFLLQARHRNGSNFMLQLCDEILANNDLLKNKMKSLFYDITNPVMQLNITVDNQLNIVFPDYSTRDKFVNELGQKKFTADHEFFPNQDCYTINSNVFNVISFPTYKDENSSKSVIAFPTKEMCGKFSTLMRHVRRDAMYMHDDLMYLNIKSITSSFNLRVTMCAEVSSLKRAAYADVRYVSRWLFLLSLSYEYIANLPHEIILYIGMMASNPLLKDYETRDTIKKNYGLPRVVENYLNDGNDNKTSLTNGLLHRQLYYTNAYNNDSSRIVELGVIFNKIMTFKNDSSNNNYQHYNLFSHKKNAKLYEHIKILQYKLREIIESSQDDKKTLMSVLENKYVSQLIDFPSRFSMKKTTKLRDIINKFCSESIETISPKLD